MLKPLIFVLALVILLAVELNFNLFFSKDENPPIQSPKNKDIVIKTPIEIPPKIDKEKTSSSSIEIKENPNDKIASLFQEAEQLFRKSNDDEALVIYDEIIKKTINQTDKQSLLYLAKACFQKAIIYQIYPNNDKDASIEAYDIVINQFENSSDVKLLEYYIEAKLQQSALLGKEETLEAYDELIKKFENFDNNIFQTKIEEILFTKSFALMGKDNEGAMQILDNIIEKYQNSEGKVLLSENVKFSILNNIELAIITNNDDENYRDLAEKYMSDSPQTKPLLDMLSIIKEAQELDQTEALAQWKEEYKDFRFNDWSFQELRTWMNGLEDEESKQRISTYLNAFESHKYGTNIYYGNNKKLPASISYEDYKNQQQRQDEY